MSSPQFFKEKIIFSFIVLFITLSVFMIATHANGATVTIKAVGSSVEASGEDAAFRQRAVDEALRAALKEAISRQVSSEAVIENYERLAQRFFENPLNYIDGYNVESESRAGRLYNVIITAEVDGEALADGLADVGLMKRRSHSPRVLFMIAEQNIEKTHFTYWWSWWRGAESEYRAEVVDVAASETRLKDIFASSDFYVVDPSAVTGEIEISDAYRLEDLDVTGATSFGTALGADIVVKGKAIAREGIKIAENPLGIYMADVTAAAISVEDGRVLASGRGHGVSRHISPTTGAIEALEEASEELALDLIEQIETRWSSRHSVIAVDITGLSGYAEFSDFKEIIGSRIKGVTGVYERRFSNEAAVLEVETRLTSGELAEAILKNSMGQSVEVIKTSENRLDIRIGPGR